MIIEEIRNIQSSKKDLRNFGLAVGTVCLGLGGLFFWKERPVWPWFGGFGLFLVCGGFLFPNVLKPLQKIWMSFAVVMGWIMTRIILSILFYLVITPISVIASLAGRRFLDQTDPSADSFWQQRGHDDTSKERCEKQY